MKDKTQRKKRDILCLDENDESNNKKMKYSYEDPETDEEIEEWKKANENHQMAWLITRPCDFFKIIETLNPFLTSATIKFEENNVIICGTNENETGLMNVMFKSDTALRKYICRKSFEWKIDTKYFKDILGSKQNNYVQLAFYKEKETDNKLSIISCEDNESDKTHTILNEMDYGDEECPEIKKIPREWLEKSIKMNAAKFADKVNNMKKFCDLMIIEANKDKTKFRLKPSAYNKYNVSERITTFSVKDEPISRNGKQSAISQNGINAQEDWEKNNSLSVKTEQLTHMVKTQSISNIVGITVCAPFPLVLHYDGALASISYVLCRIINDEDENGGDGDGNQNERNQNQRNEEDSRDGMDRDNDDDNDNDNDNDNDSDKDNEDEEETENIMDKISNNGNLDSEENNNISFENEDDEEERI